ncbi:MAG: ClpP family protease [Ancrocorticia sp.]|uniref:ClpP family protease n=1 Tax=Ancrocorticia sp. TaxID=2593684 RepID=UPI003F935D1A
MSEDSKPPVFSEPYRRELYARRTLVLDGQLDDDNGTLLAVQMASLAAEEPHSDINLWIHSPGGSVPAMLAIRDLIRVIPNDVATLALGIACSAGQFLLTAGTPGKRRALPHSRILMHQGSAGIGGSTTDVELQAEDLKHTRDTVLGITSEDTGQPLHKIFEDSLHDHWFSAAEAQEYGFIDSIVSGFEEIIQPDPRAAGFHPTDGQQGSTVQAERNAQ